MRKFIVITLIVAVILCMMGCANEKRIDSNDNEIVDIESSLLYKIIVDGETGVNYIVYAHGGISPRYHRNGMLYVSEVD